MKDIRELTSVLSAMKMLYKKEFARIKEEYETEVNRVRRVFRDGTKDKAEALQEAEEKFKTDIGKLKAECIDMYEPVIAELEAKAKTKAAKMDKTLVETVRMLESIPLSSEEFSCILKEYGGRNYYSDRILEMLAAENGITNRGVTANGEPLLIEPNLQTKLKVLEELRGQAIHLGGTYGTPEENEMSRIGDLFPDVLERAEMRFTNGLYEGSATPKQIAVRVIDNLRTKGGRASGYLDRVLANSSNIAKKAIMNELLRSDEGSVKAAIARSRSKMEIEAFANGEVEKYRAAESAIENLYAALENKEVANAIIDANRANPYFGDLYESDATLTELRFNGIGTEFEQV